MRHSIVATSIFKLVAVPSLSVVAEFRERYRYVHCGLQLVIDLFQRYVCGITCSPESSKSDEEFCGY